MAPKFIAIEGNIGAGKTALAHLLAAEFGSELLLEEYENNPYLAPFFEDQKKYAQSLEDFFLSTREKQLDHFFSKNTNPSIVSDFSLHKSFIFAKNNLAAKDLPDYTLRFKNIEKKYPKPDLLIFLDTSLERLKQNIRQRGRIYEKNIKTSYLEQIAESYETFLSSVADFPILRINATNIDFVNKKDDFNKIIIRIRENQDEERR